MVLVRDDVAAWTITFPYRQAISVSPNMIFLPPLRAEAEVLTMIDGFGNEPGAACVLVPVRFACVQSAFASALVGKMM